jgi:hypothetical protein
MLCEQFPTERKQISINSKSNENFLSFRQKHESLDNTKASFKKTSPSTLMKNSNSNHKRQVSDNFGYNSPIQNEKLNLRCS